MKLSHADYMAEQMQRMLLQLCIEYPVKLLCQLACCSTSEIYTWRSQGMDDSKAKYVLAMIAGLAERGDRRWIESLLLPIGDRIVSPEDDALVNPNGSCDDEVADAMEALADARRAHKGRNPEGIAEARRQIRTIDRRLEGEENELRAQQNR